MEKVIALFGVFGLGMCFSLLGSISVKLMPRLKIDQGKFGTLVSVFMFSCLIASLLIGVAVDSIGYKPVAIFGFLAAAGCIFYLANGKSYTFVVIPCILLGFGAMALNVVGNTLGPKVLFQGNPAAASNLVNVFFGLGLFLTPLTVSFLFQKTSYEKAVSALGLFLIIPAVLSLVTVFSVEEDSLAFSIGDAAGLLTNPAVLVAAFVLFCYISLEASFCNWLPAFGKDVIKTDSPSTPDEVADASAQRLLSLFAIGMMVGRFGASQIEGITEFGSYFIAGAALVSGVLIIIMTRTRQAFVAMILAALAGLAFAPVFPTTLGVTFAKFPSEIHGSVFGIIFAIGLAGAVIAPKAIGNLARGSSVQKSLKLLIPVCGLLLVLGVAIGMVGKAESADKADKIADGEPVQIQAAAETVQETAAE